MRKYNVLKNKYNEDIHIIRIFLCLMVGIVLLILSGVSGNILCLIISFLGFLLAVKSIVKISKNFGYYLTENLVFAINLLILLLINIILYSFVRNTEILAFLIAVALYIMTFKLITLMIILPNSDRSYKKKCIRSEKSKIKILFEKYSGRKKEKRYTRIFSDKIKSIIGNIIAAVTLYVFSKVGDQVSSRHHLFLTIAISINLAIYLVRKYYYYSCETTFSNIDILDVFHHPISFMSVSGKVSKRSRAFELSVKSILPPNSEIKRVALTNHQLKTNYPTTELPEGFYDKIFLTFDVNKPGKYTLNKLYVEYNFEGRNYIDFFAIEIVTELVGNELLITSCLVVDYTSTKNKIRNKLRMRVMSLHNVIENCQLDYINLIGNYYYYNLSNRALSLESNNLENRKFIIHNDEFGVGKTAYDTLVVYDENKTPIPISVWQENYDHELLFVLFNRIKKKSNTKFTGPTFQTFPTFIAIVTVFVSLALLILKERHLFTHLLAFRANLLIRGVPSLFLSSELIILFFACLGVLISLLFAPEFMIYKNNTSEYYQDFYLKRIEKMVRKKNLVLIIEDLDRLDVDTIEKCFRMIANLNYQFVGSSKIIGILPFDEEVIKEKFHGKYSDKLTPFRGDSKNYDEIIEKIAVENVFETKLRNELFKREYLQKLLDFYYLCLIWDVKITNEEIDKLNNIMDDCISICSEIVYENLSLREIREIIEVMISDCSDKLNLDNSMIYKFLLKLKVRSDK